MEKIKLNSLLMTKKFNKLAINSKDNPSVFTNVSDVFKRNQVLQRGYFFDAFTVQLFLAIGASDLHFFSLLLVGNRYKITDVRLFSKSLKRQALL